MHSEMPIGKGWTNNIQPLLERERETLNLFQPPRADQMPDTPSG